MEEKVQYQSEERLRDIQVGDMTRDPVDQLRVSGTNRISRDENIHNGASVRSASAGRQCPSIVMIHTNYELVTRNITTRPQNPMSDKILHMLYSSYLHNF